MAGPFALNALAGNDDVRISGSNTISDTKTGTVETTGTMAAVSGSNGVTNNVGEGTKHGSDDGSGK